MRFVVIPAVTALVLASACQPIDRLQDDCQVDQDCQGDLLCLAGACRPGCHDDSGCELGRICETSVCVDGCRSSRYCPGGWQCLTDIGTLGACAECQDDSGCGTAHCDRAVWRCVDCLEDAHCEGGTHCVEQACLEGPDLFPPEVLSTYPPADALDVPPDTKFQIQFSESIERTSLQSDAFHLLREGRPLYGTVSYDQARRRATLVLTIGLERSALYEAVLEPGVKDLAGNSMREATRWSFWSAP